MASINREILKDFSNEGFFDTNKSIEEVVLKLDTRGFKITDSKKGLVAQLLTKLYQEGILEREKDAENKYKYRKRKNG